MFHDPPIFLLDFTPRLCYNRLEHKFHYSRGNPPPSNPQSLISILQVVLHFFTTPAFPYLDLQPWQSALLQHHKSLPFASFAHFTLFVLQTPPRCQAILLEHTHHES
jgi:hypothetical protein